MIINISPQAKKDLTVDERKYLMLLEFHKQFDEVIDEAREKYFGWPIPKNHSLELILEIEKKDVKAFTIPSDIETTEATYFVMEKLKIPGTLFVAIERLLSLGQINALNHQLFVFGYRATSGRDLIRHPRIPNMKYPQITILKRMGKDAFIDQIKNYWPQIKRAMTEIESEDTISRSIRRKHVEVLELDIEIFRLKEKGKLKYKEIAERINKSGVDEEFCKKRYSETKKFLIKIGFR